MWVDRNEWDKLNRRVAELESRMSSAQDQHYFAVYEELPPGMNHYGIWREPQRIEVRTVLECVLGKLGLKLQYRGGKPAGVDVVEPPQNAGAGF